MPLPMPIRPMRSTLIPRWLRALCVARFEHADVIYGDLWATRTDHHMEAIDEIADTVNYAEFGRERGVPKRVVWAIQFMCGLQARLVDRYFRRLPPAGEAPWDDVAAAMAKLGAEVFHTRDTTE